MMDHLIVICVYWSEPLACAFGVYAIKTFMAIQDDVSNKKMVNFMENGVNGEDTFHLFSHLKTDIPDSMPN